MPTHHPPSAWQYGSVCSGIEAVSLAWQPLGLHAAWFSEIDAFACAVLAHHYPHIPNLGDMTHIADQIRTGGAVAPDILVGGTPCQSFSAAGCRRGLDDPRGALSLTFVELANAVDQIRHQHHQPPTIFVWENVPGVLGDRANAFGQFLGALAGEVRALEPAGNTWTHAGAVFGPQRRIAWRVLDAQYFGLAQRRPRVFLVASGRDDFHPAEILFERQSQRGTAAPRPPLWQTHSRETGMHPASTGGHGGLTADGDTPVMAFSQSTCGQLRWESGRGQITGVLRTSGSKPGQGTPVVLGRFTPDSERGLSACTPAEAAPWSIRCLMPKECERLQGMPDDYTLIPWRGGLAADTPRYKAIGNAMAVPCMAWLGQRLLAGLNNTQTSIAN